MWLFSLSSRRIAIIVLFLVVSTFSFSQNSVSIGTTSTNPKAVLWLSGTNQGIIIPIVSNKTSVSAGPTEKGMVIFDDSDKKVYFYDGTAWNQVGGSGAAGSQGIAINGNTVQLNSTAGATFGLSNTAPTGKGQLLVWDGTKWDATLAPTTTGQTLSWDNTNGKWTLANASLTLAGDVSGPSNNTTIASTSGNNIVAALNNAATTSKLLPAQISAGTPNQVLTTSAGNVAVWANLPTATGTVTNIATGTGLTGGPITTTGTIALANTSVAPATYGSTTQIPQITVDAQGRITNASNVTPSLAGVAATGFLSAADWNTFNNKLSTESDPTVKAINGLVKSNGTTIGAVVSGTDIKTINGASILGAGNITAVTAETDPTVKAINGIVKSNGTTISAATAGTDYVATETDPSVKAINGLVKSNGTTISAAVPGTDYLTTNQTITLSGDLSGSGTTAITTSIGATAGNSIVTAINNAGTLGTINDNRLATITSTGKVNGGAITTGTIGGNTAINSTGNIATTGTLAAGATTVSGLTVTGPTTSINGASLTWPASNLAGVLTNDGTGALTWAPSSVVSPANKVISGNATGTAQVASSIFDDGTYTAVGRTVPVSASGRFEIDATGFGSNAYGGMNLMTDNQGSPYYGYGNNGGSRMWTYYHGLSGSWRVWNGGTERLTITSTGDIGIGTTTPAAKLDIVGNIKIADGTQGLGKVLTSDANGLASWQAVSGTGTVTSITAGTGLTGGTITSSGSLAVDVGTTANKIVQLDGTGKLPAVDGSQLTNLPAGTETDPTVKAINGIVKSNGTTISAATAGTDYQAPLVSGTNIKTINGASVLGAGNITAVTTETDPTVKAINGLVKSDGTTIGAVVSGTDVKTINGTSILGAGNITAVTTETDPTVKAINGLVKSNGTTISAATAGTDYLAPNGNGSALTNLNASNLASGTVPTARIDVGTTANKIVQLDATGKLPAVDGSQLTNLPAAAETDPTVKAINGLVKSNGTTISAATPGTDYVATEADPTVKAINGLVKSNGTTISAAVPGTDYLTTNQNITLSGDITGSGTTAITTTVSKINGSTWPANASGSLTNDGSGNLTWVPSGGSGTVTSITKGVGIVPGAAITTSGTIDVNVGTGANQIVQLDGTGKLPAVDGSQLTNLPAGTETDPTVKAINGLVKSNGTAISAAVAGTDYVATETDPSVKAINGIVKSNGTTLGAVVSGTDIKTINGASILGAGNITAITTETDPTVTAINGLVKSNGTTISAATAGTDYLAPNGNGSALTNLNASNISSGTLAIANGGTGATTAPAARTALGLGTLSTLSTVTSAEITDGTIANADVNASAAIAGSKINPSFGAQPVSTTSTLTTGSAGQFVVDATGNITKINNITTSFPATQGAANSVLTNDGAGNLTWAAGSGWSLSGNALAGGEKIGSTNGNPLPFITNNVERMRIDPSGNVGIGTAAPTQPLHVAGPEGQFLVTPNLSGPGATSLMAQLINTTSKGPQVRFAGAVGGAAFNDIGQDATGNFVIEASDVPLLTLNQNGALGVGSTPSFGTSGFVLTSNGSGGAPTWQAVSGTGTVTSISAGTGLTGGPITTTGTLAVDVGTTANKIVQLDGTGKLPAVDGSQLINLPAGAETDPTVKAINGIVKSNGTTISAATAGTDYQAPLVSGTNIKTINGASVLGAGNITAVTTETDPTVTAINGLVKSNGTTISAATAGTDYLAPNGNGSALTNLNASNLASGTVPTARIDVGTTANKIVQLDATGKLPAVDGSQLTNLPTAAETDPTVKAINGLVKSNGTTISAATAGTDYLAPNGNGSALTNLNASNISSGTLAITNGGTGASTAPAARTALGLGSLATLSAVASADITDNTIVDADVNASAAIAGSKINPNFGAQAISTTGTLTTGSAGQFVVDPTGNITKLNGATTSFPSTNAAGVLTNDGTGTLTWSAPSSGWSLSGNATTLGNKLGTTNGNPLTFITSGTDRMTIDATGNIGIGTASPTAPLTISGATSMIDVTNTGGGQNWRIVSDTDGTLKFVKTSGSTFPPLTLNGNGAIGIYDGVSAVTFGSAGQVLTSGGPGAVPTWSNPTAFSTLNSIPRGDGTSMIASGITDNGTTINHIRATTVNATVDNGSAFNSINSSLSGATLTGITGQAIGNGGNGYGVRGTSTSAQWNVGGEFSGTGAATSNYGVTATASGGFNENRGVVGTATGTAGSSSAWGVTGDASAGTTNYGIYGTAAGGTTNWAGFFNNGNVHISNALSVGADSFGADGEVLTSHGSLLPPTWEPAGGSGWSLSGNATTLGNKLGTTNGNPLTLITSNTDRLTIDAAGNVGIGTTSPAQKLSVQGGMNIDNGDAATGTITNGLTFGFGSSEGISSKRNPGGNQFGLDFYTQTVNRMSITNTGNVGIGTTNPLTPLQLGGSLGFVNAGGDDIMAHGIYFDGSNFINRGASANSAILLGDGKAGIYTFPAGAAAGVASSPNMRFNVRPTGVGIQVDNPIETFQVNGATYLNPITAPSTTTDRLYNVGGNLFWNGTNISSGGSGWSLAGNAGTNSSTDFIGTTDNTALRFKTNNNTSGLIDPLNSNVFFGYIAGQSTTGTQNVAIGTNAFTANTTGSGNVALGTGALQTNSTGTGNIAIGNFADVNSSGLINAIAIGRNAKVATSNSLVLGGTGGDAVNVGIGTTSPKSKFQVGNRLGLNSASVSSFDGITRNIYIDATDAPFYTNTGFANAILMQDGLTELTVFPSGSANAAIASPTTKLAITSTGVGINTAAAPVATLDVNGQIKISGGTPGVGKVLTSDATGLATWQNAGGSGWGLTGNASTVDGINFIGTTDNIPLNFRVNGQKAGRIDHLQNNAFFGYQAGNVNTAAGNTALGSLALQLNTTGNANTAVGYNALQANTTANYNSAFGNVALNSNTGFNNTATGYRALFSNTSASGNTAMGSDALSASTGNNNTAVGYSALITNTTGSSNTAIGHSADVLFNNLTNATAIGYNAKVGASNTIALGGTGADAVNVGIGTTSSLARLHIDVASNNASGLQLTNARDIVGAAIPVLINATTSGQTFGADTYGRMLRLQNNSFQTFDMGIGSTGGFFLTRELNYSPADFNISLSGNVGFGTANPNGFSGKLVHLSGTGNTAYILEKTDATARKWAMVTGNTGEYIIQDMTGSVNAFAIAPGGNVGIGTTSPSALLDVNSAANGMRINGWFSSGASIGGAAYVGTNLYRNFSDNVWKYTNTHGSIGGAAIQFNGIGGGGTENDILFVRTTTPGTANANATVSESMRIKGGTGYVGIGTNSPGVPLDITTSPISINDPSLTFFNDGNGGGLSVNENQTPNISVRATGGFLSTGSGFNGGFYVTSDKRIKKVVGISDSKNDLSTLMKLRVTDYKFVDSLNTARMQVKGVLAQEVETVYPQAISKQTNFIPNVYAIANSLEYDEVNHKLNITLTKPHGLVVGDKVKLISSTSGEKPAVVSAATDNMFTVSDWTEKSEKIFVYGKEVNDFRIVDYDRLFTLNISATQELVKLVEEQKKVIDELKAKEEENKKKIALLEASLNKAATSESELATLKTEIEKIKAALGLTVDAALPKKEEKK